MYNTLVKSSQNQKTDANCIEGEKRWNYTNSIGGKQRDEFCDSKRERYKHFVGTQNKIFKQKKKRKSGKIKNYFDVCGYKHKQTYV